MDLFSGKKAKCAGCGNSIDKKEAKVEALKKPWHAACFVCQQCSTPLKGDFRSVEDKPWCERCYGEKKAPKCAECGKGILEKRIKTDDGRSFHEECFSRASQGVCVSCDKDIGLGEPVIEAMGHMYHSHCFKCTECGGDMPAEFRLRDDKPVCDKCYKHSKKEREVLHEDTKTEVRDVEGHPDQKEITEYRESTRTIHDNENVNPNGTKTVVRDAEFAGVREGEQMARNSFGLPLHRTTNVRDDVEGPNCAVCLESTAKESHVAANGRTFHRNCFDSAHSGECHGCQQKIRLSESSVAVPKLGRDWHSACFNCSKCFGNINGAFQLHQDAPICDGCYRQHVAPLCNGCGQPIDGDKLKALQNIWHPNCFNCSVCHVPLVEKGKEFFNVEGKPYCKNDLEAANIMVVG